jgi:hypothetical protein
MAPRRKEAWTYAPDARIQTLQVHCNVWSYMAFGTIYASWLTLIHSEIQHPWDPVFRKLGLGTASDHHVSIFN